MTEQPLDSKTLILLESEEVAKETLEGIVLDHDLSIRTAFDWGDALRLMVQSEPLAFVFSLRSISGEPVEQIRRLKQRFPETPLIGIQRPGQDQLVEHLLQAGLHSNLDSTRLAEEFTFHLVKLLAGRTDSYHTFSLHYEERLLLVPNDFALVMPVAKALVDDSLPPNEKRRYHLILGLSEMITNAIEHGNLGFSFSEKSVALKASGFFALAQDRSQRDPYRSRVVTIRRRVLPHLRRIEFFISDQGQGFDWRNLPDPKDKANLYSRHGRGLLMARHAFDEMRFNEAGNEVTLVVDFDAPPRKKN